VRALVCGRHIKLQVIVQLQQLSDLGVAISIDDFGTGFSFLSYVKRLPVRALVCGRHIFGRHFPFRVAETKGRAREAGNHGSGGP
jgi:predicted signal transduction protein with EAL and GGDEF domain